MKQNIWKYLLRSMSLLLAISMIISCVPLPVFADDAADPNDPIVIVSLGDSFSSGEGIEPFYGQEKAWTDRVVDKDWLAHRSTKSWPSLLEIKYPDGSSSGTMSNYKVTDTVPSQEYKWYFAAVSGAVTSNINYIDENADPSQHKYYHKKEVRKKEVYNDELRTEWLPPQLEIFNTISENDAVDYVTLTIGGNDVKFTQIIVDVATSVPFIYNPLDKQLEDLWKEDNINSVKEKLTDTYMRIQNAAGPQAAIIVAGYPELLDDEDGGGAHISKEEARKVNESVVKFNYDVLKKLVEDLDNSMNIHFVDVIPEFNKDGGHQAYKDNAWINGIDIIKKDNDLNRKALSSAYSVHPNAEGAKAYARCVNAKIAEIEAEKRAGTLTGKICMATDRITPVADASVTINSLDINKSWGKKSDASGSYEQQLPAGRYLVTVLAEGYIDFHAYATIGEYETVFMETFLMVKGEESDIGTATGKITNALTGNGVSGITLDVRSGWNNDTGEILTTTTTDDSGNYTITLPIGNYTLCASKEGYIPTVINVVVQKDICTTKNGSMTPIISGDSFRIVLTWGSSPSDLDSHVVGTLSSGSSFHVYYGDKSEYDGEVEVCNLDVDDTSSYGPETITLNTTTDNPYYYYIYNYSSTTGMITSEAQIKVYQGDTLVATFNVPTNQADARYWNVFAIVDGEMVVSNTVTSSADLSYANTTSQMRQMPINVDASMEANPKVVTDSE